MDRDTVAKTAQNCNMKKEGAKLAQEQSAHLFLCLLLHVSLLPLSSSRKSRADRTLLLLSYRTSPSGTDPSFERLTSSTFSIRLSMFVAFPPVRLVLRRSSCVLTSPSLLAQVIVPEFGIEKRVHADQMPLEVRFASWSRSTRSLVLTSLVCLSSQNHVYDEHTDTLQLYWSDRDVITFLAERESRPLLFAFRRVALAR